MHSRFVAALRAAALATILTAGSAQAHEGHDHGDAPAPAPTVTTPRGEAVWGALELVAVVRGGTLTAFVDHFATNEPVAGAALTVEAPDGPVTLKEEAGGSYTTPTPWLSKPGKYDLLFTVTTNGTADVLPITVAVPEASPGPQTVPAAPVLGLRERLTRQDPVMMAVAALAFLLGVVVTMLVRRRQTVPAIAVLAISAALVWGTAAFAHEGEDHNEAREPAAAGGAPAVAQGDLAQRLPDGTVFVPKPTQRILAIRTVMSEAATYSRVVELPGRIIPDPNASGVVQSSVGGRLSAPPGGFPRLGTPVKHGAVLAYVTPPVQRIDVSDMRQRQGELDQQIAIIERRVERYRKLAVSGAVAQVQLDEALEELKGLRDRRAALDRSRSEPEALIAPVDGIIAETTAVAGQMAAPGGIVFQVIDPAHLWVEALSFEATTGTQASTARLADGRTLQLSYQGAGIADRNQSVPVQFAVQGDTSGLRIGQFVTVQAVTSAQAQGLALPRSSIVRTDNGQDVVFEHVTAERFASRPVRVAPLDGGRVLVAAGLSPGKRIVTQGAELLDQVR